MKRIILLTLFTFLLFTFDFLLVTCDSTDSTVPPKPYGYQEDVPWPSLADTPWPMERCDPQATGRSRYPGPRNGVIEWVIEDFEPYSSISIGKDSSIYCRSFNNKSPGFKAIKPNGEFKWSLHTGISGGEEQTSTVLNNGDILTNANSNLYLINLNGECLWAKEGPYITSAVSIDKNKNIYALDYKLIAEYDPNGNLLWSNSNYTLGFEYWISFSPDGNTIYLPGRGNPVFYAFDVTAKLVKWEFGYYGSLSRAPLVDSQGNLYIITENDLLNPDYNHAALYSLSPEGSIRWKYDLGKRDIDSEVQVYQGIAMDKLGNIYAGHDSLVSIDYSGKRRWSKGYDYPFRILSPITIDCEGYVYFILSDFVNSKLLAYTPEGKLLFSTTVPLKADYTYSPAIGYDNSIYIASFTEPKLIKIK